MADAVLSVAFAGPLVTFQDAGRPGHMKYGVPASGPMDRLAFDAANAALGNAPGATAIEISLGGLMLHCTSGAVTLAVTGGEFSVEHAGRKTTGWTILTLQKGERLAIRAGKAGSWAYLAVAGALDGEVWLGSQATHSPSGFGGGTLKSGQSIRVKDAAIRDTRLGMIPPPDFVTTAPMRVVIGPQERHFVNGAVEQLAKAAYRLTDAYDRMGLRLSGPALQLDGALSIPSEPVIRGAIQVSGDGIPTVLLADHQTTGGYPKIATLISCDTDRLAQFRPGQVVRFTPISSQQAISDMRHFHEKKAQYLAQVSVPRGSLEQRLMRENLIHGWASD